jgi:hypothetical protein
MYQSEKGFIFCSKSYFCSLAAALGSLKIFMSHIAPNGESEEIKIFLCLIKYEAVNV